MASLQNFHLLRSIFKAGGGGSAWCCKPLAIANDLTSEPGPTVLETTGSVTSSSFFWIT